MNPPVAARAPASTLSLHDRRRSLAAARPSLHRRRLVGTPSGPVTNPVNGVELAKVLVLSTVEARRPSKPPSARSRPGQAHRQTAFQHPRKRFDLIIANREDLR